MAMPKIKYATSILHAKQTPKATKLGVNSSGSKGLARHTVPAALSALKDDNSKAQAVPERSEQISFNKSSTLSRSGPVRVLSNIYAEIHLDMVRQLEDKYGKDVVRLFREALEYGFISPKSTGDSGIKRKRIGDELKVRRDRLTAYGASATLRLVGAEEERIIAGNKIRVIVFSSQREAH
jgi:hypothetical protein